MAKKKMVKKVFSEELAVKLGLTASATENILNAVIWLIYEQLAAGKKVQWSGFGTFSVSHRKPRIGVNPRRPSEKITIPELNTPKFKAGEAFKAAVKLR